MNIKKSLQSISFLWLAALLGSGSTFIINMILARQLGKESFGILSAVMATILIFSIIASFGVSQVWLKLFGKEGQQGIRWIKPSLKFVFINLLLVSIGLVFWSFFGPHTHTIRWIHIILLAHIYGYVAISLVAAKMQLEEKFVQLSLWQLLPNLTRLIVVVLGFYFLDRNMNILDVSIVYGIIGFIFFLVGFYSLSKMQNSNFKLAGHSKTIESEEISKPKIKAIFYESLPFGLGNVFAFVYVQSDIIMLKYISGNEQAGLYSAAFLILAAIYLFPNIVYNKYLMPKFHRWANHQKTKFFQVYTNGNKIMLLIGFIFCLAIILLSDFFMPILFGDEFIKSIGLLKVLSLTIPFIFLGYSTAATLVTRDNMKKKVVYMGIIACVNIALNLFLIPIYQSLGAAYATICSNALLVIIYVMANKKYVFNIENS